MLLKKTALSGLVILLLILPIRAQQTGSPRKLPDLRAQGQEMPPKRTTNITGQARMTEAEFITSITGYLDQLATADEFSGTVWVAKGGTPIFQKAYGLASIEYNIPNRIDTKFNLGSINKIFTQIAIGQLAEQRQLSLDDKLGKYLPDYPNREAAEKVSIRQLLNMTSGIGDFFGPQFQAMPKSRIRAIKDYLPLFAAKPLEFEPGTKRQYSNGGYIVLGAIIERITGQDYYSYVREHIFKPAGMQDTDWYESDLPTPDLASGYTQEGTEEQGKNARRNNIYTRPARGSSAGGGYSTAVDLLKFSLALQSGKLRLPSFRDPVGPEKQNSSGDNKQPGPAGIGIAGGAPGINGVLEVDFKRGYTLIVLSNYDPPSAEKVGRQIHDWLARINN